MQKIAAALFTIALAPVLTQAQSLRTITSMPLSKFQDSLGINLHIEYTDGEYANEPQVLKDLQYIGIHNVRDSIPDPLRWAPGGAQHLEALASAGIHFDFVGDCNASFSTAMQQLNALAAEYPGIAKSVEGPNEINNFACSAGSGSNLQQATSYQQELYSYVHGDSLLKNVPVLYMTGAPSINLLTSKGLADDANEHPYPYAEEEPYNRLRQEYDADYSTPESSIARQITETGYFTIPTAQDGVDQTGQAQMLLNLYFDAALEGYQHTYVYQLLDAYNDTSSDNNYGLFNYNGTAKTSATMLHNLYTLMPPDKTSAQKTVQAAVSSMSATAHTMAFTASDGSIYFFMWNENPAWNGANHSTIVHSTNAITVKIAGNWTVKGLSPATSQLTSNVPENSDGSYTCTLTQYPTALVFHPK
jgi:hypothetical protein